MLESDGSSHLTKLSRIYSDDTWHLYELLDTSLEPRGPDWLVAKAGSYLHPGATVLDAGCRDAAHLIRLVQENGVTGIGIEPVVVHVERARAAVAAANLEGRIEVVHGTIEGCDFPDGCFDFIWCRDVLEQVESLPAFMHQLARLLRPSGVALVFTIVATDLLEPGDRTLLGHHMGVVEANLSESNLEGSFAGAGLRIRERNIIGTEWREHAEERTQPISRALLRLARLRRRRNEIFDSPSEDIYRHVEANLHWDLLQMLGKLQPIVYVLERE